MMTTRFFFLSTLLASTVALADSDTSFDRPLYPVFNALEIAIGGGYTQPYGASGVGVDAQDVAGPGGNAQLELGYRRIARNFALSPVIGATATTYLDHDTSMTSAYRDIDSKEISWTFSGGLLGRFDIGM